MRIALMWPAIFKSILEQNEQNLSESVVSLSLVYFNQAKDWALSISS